ncbi:nuclease-related domain-containing protein [Agromyces soli]
MPEHPTATHTLESRPPAASVIAECLRTQATAPPCSAGARFFGREPLSADASPWYRGALGELEVARRLTALGPAWRVLHSVPVGRGTSDIDHVVIGPPGVFTINTKHHEGRDIWLGAKRLLVSGQPTDHLRNARFEAKRASQRMSVAMHALVDVAPIVAIVGARRITVRERPTTVFVMRERELVGWLTALPPVVPPADVARLVEAAAQPSTWHDSPSLEPVDVAAFERLRSEVARARSRRRGWAAVGFLGLLGLLPVAAMLAWISLVGLIAR